MKSFENFISSLKPEDIEQIKADVLKNHTPESATNAIVNMSFEISLKLLEKYHNWLNN